MAYLTLLVVVVLVATIVVMYDPEAKKAAKALASKSRLPGPKGLPLIGNVHELPAKCSWMKFHEWAVQYGPIYQVNLAGQNHVWIARDKIAHDLLSKRSAIYSDRPFIPALEKDNRTSGQYLPLMSKNLVWSRQRRFAKQIMDKSQKDSFYSYPELESIRLLFELMTDPSKYNTAMESFVARVTSRLAWGTPAPADELKQRARELLIGVSPTGAFGNKLPAVMSLPEKMSASKAWELRRGRTEKAFFETMQEEVRQSLESESAPSSPTSASAPSPLLSSPQPKQSWTRMYLEHAKTWGFDGDTEGAYAVGMHGIAGALTIAAPMQSFCLAMCHYPQYQSVLHEEIDRVLGDRMPTFSDMPDMPVLRAFIRETLRWRPPVPTGIPHLVTQDDNYEGYHIPKDSVIHPLEWSISRDPDMFPDADAWNPMRWLESKYPTYQEPLAKYPTITQYSQFGYGRRTCQGMGVTEADLFVGLGSVAWLFSMNGEEASKTTTDESVTSSNAPSTASSVTDPGSRRGSNASDVSLSYYEDSRRGSRPEEPVSREKQLNGGLTNFRNDSAISVSSNFGNPSNLHAARRRPNLTLHRNDSAIDVSADESAQCSPYTPNTQRHFDSPTSVSSSPRSRQNSETSSPDSTSNIPSITVVDEEPEDEDDDDQFFESPDATNDDCLAEICTPGLPGCWDFPSEPDAPEPEKNLAPDYDADPTMNFSTLLIAKPLPFKFKLSIRNQARAQLVAKQWVERKMEGEFLDARVYWKGGVEGDQECGWGEVFS